MAGIWGGTCQVCGYRGWGLVRVRGMLLCRACHKLLLEQST